MFEVERKAEGGGGGWEGEGGVGAFKGWGAGRCGGGILRGGWWIRFFCICSCIYVGHITVDRGASYMGGGSRVNVFPLSLHAYTGLDGV